jgi:hypothetical protein
MEDVSIGRNTLSSENAFVVGTSAVLLVSGSNERVALVLGAPNAGVVTYSTNPSPTFGQGINVSVGSGQFRLNITEDGDLVRKPWYAIADAAGRGIAIQQVFLAAQKSSELQ